MVDNASFLGTDDDLLPSFGHLQVKKTKGSCPYSRHESVECGRSYVGVRHWARRRRASIDAVLAFLQRHDEEDEEELIERRQSWAATYFGRISKPANAFIRWYLLMTLFLFSLLSSPVWIIFTPGIRDTSMDIIVVASAFFNLIWIVGVVNALRYSQKLLRHKLQTNATTEPESGVSGTIKHLVGICIYKEPFALLKSTIDSIATQPGAKEKMSVVIGIEEETPNRDEIQQNLFDDFQSLFENFFVIVHPKGLPGDIPGKCSNLNYAMRAAADRLNIDGALSSGAHQFLVTTGDCDSIFGDGYFEALASDCWKNSPEERLFTVWQSPLFYSLNLSKSPFFVRITGLLRSFFMMAFLIPFNINSMSIFSLTFELYKSGSFTHPGYQMEDIIALIRWSLVVRRQCRIRVLPVATLSGPTSGESFLDEVYEWSRQIRRWCIGAAEVFHYFVIKSPSLPLTTAFAFAVKFIGYYGVLLGVAPLYPVFASITMAITHSLSPEKTLGLVVRTNETFIIAMAANLAISLFGFVAAVAINKRCEEAFPEKHVIRSSILQNLLDCALSWPVSVAHAVVAIFSFIEVTIRGKSACSHNASKKEDLVIP